MHCDIEIFPPKRKFCCRNHKNTYNSKHLYNYKYTKNYRGRNKENYLKHLLSYKRRYETITLDNLIKLWDEQKGKCAISGLELTFTQSSGFTITNASIDRINSNKGYELDNIQLVGSMINRMKTDLPQDEFIKLCGIIWEKNAQVESWRQRTLEPTSY